MTEIKGYNIDELIDRLLDSCFDFRIEDNKLIIKSYTDRENKSSVLGFAYWGNKEEYYYDLGDIQIQDIISDAFATYNRYIEEYVRKSVEKFYSSLTM